MWAQYPQLYDKELKERGLKYWLLPDGQPAMDFPPGKNRVSLFDDFKSRQYEIDLLERFGVGVNFLGSVTITSLLKADTNIDVPYVLKNPDTNKGKGKLLISDEQQHRKVLEFLRSKRKGAIERLIAEPYCEPPGDYNSSFRVTMTPGGTIHGATITRSNSRKQSVRATWRDAGQLLEPLTEPDSPYFINSSRVASNIDGDKAYIGLDFPGRWYELTSSTDEDKQVLNDYAIDSVNPTIPEKVLDAAIGIGRVLGPGVGLHIGIDLILSRDSNVYLLETNNTPEYTSIYKTMSSEQQQPSDDELRDLAFRVTVQDLSDGVFKETQVAV